MHTIIYCLIPSLLLSLLTWLYLSHIGFNGIRASWGRLVSYYREKSARGKIEVQWPEALLLLSGALEAGLNMEEAIKVLQKNSPEPLKSYLAQNLKEEEAWLSFSRKMDRLFKDPSLSLGRATLVMAQETGGRAGVLLKTCAVVMRKNLEMKEKIKTLTAQSKLTAWVVGLSPLGFMAGMAALYPELMKPFFQTRAGWILMALVILLVASGLFVVHRMAELEP